MAGKPVLQIETRGRHRRRQRLRRRPRGRRHRWHVHADRGPSGRRASASTSSPARPSAQPHAQSSPPGADRGRRAGISQHARSGAPDRAAAVITTRASPERGGSQDAAPRAVRRRPVPSMVCPSWPSSAARMSASPPSSTASSGSATAIVEDRARTTRDRLYATAEWNDRRFVIIDTGGLEHRPGDAIEEKVQEQARLAIEEADVIVFVVDAAAGRRPADQEADDLLRRGSSAGHRGRQQGRQREARARGRGVPPLRLGGDLRHQRAARPRHGRPARRDRVGAAARIRVGARAQAREAETRPTSKPSARSPDVAARGGSARTRARSTRVSPPGTRRRPPTRRAPATDPRRHRGPSQRRQVVAAQLRCWARSAPS